MSHERAFLEAIREHPDDDAPRLIFADWLEEQGGAERSARAHFIRVQCRLATLPDDDDERDELEDEVADLLAEYEDQWTEPLHGIAEDWRMERGFIEHIVVRGETFLRYTERLFDSTPLRSVNLLLNPHVVPKLISCPALQWLETLDFTRCHLHDRSLQQLLSSPHLTRLRALNLTGNEISTPGIQALVQSPVVARLRSLDLSRNRALGDRAIHLLIQASSLANLESLRVAGTNLTWDGLYELLQSAYLPRLTELNLAGIRSSFAPVTLTSRRIKEPRLLKQLHRLDLSETRVWFPRAWLGSPQLANLRALHLRDLALESEDVQLLRDSAHLTNLTHLDLRVNNLADAGIQVLADSPHLASLTNLDVSSNHIRDTGVKAIASSRHLTRLRVLNLSDNGIGGPGLEALAGSSNLDRVQTLRLAGNFIGSESVRALAVSKHLRRLIEFDLSEAFLDENSARELASAPNLNRLTKLLLKRNMLGDGGAHALANSPHLQRLTHLNLNDNRIGKAGAEALAASPHWRRLRRFELGGNVFTDTEEILLRERFGAAVRFAMPLRR